jgi:nucleoside 2-deoxyribosyltransferase
MSRPLKIYLANALGFQTELAEKLNFYTQALEKAGFSVFEPFSGAAAAKTNSAEQIAANNCEQIYTCDIVVALLDGSGIDTDSGVAWEMGYAFARNKSIYALHSEKFRNHEAHKVNLQIEYSIKRCYDNFDDLLKSLALLKE